MNRQFISKVAVLAILVLILGSGLSYGDKQDKTGTDTKQPAACCPEAADQKACCPAGASTDTGAQGTVGDSKSAEGAQCCPADTQKCDKNSCVPPPGCCGK